MRLSSRMLSLAFVLLLAGCGPLVMIPGGALSGEVQATPDSWAFTDATEVVQLETNPADPYSVNVWGVAAGDAFYVAAGDPTSTWARNIDVDPLVRLRVEQSLYELQAQDVTDTPDRDLVLAALQKKYDFEPDPEEKEKARLFKLIAR